MSRDITKAASALQEFWPKLERWYADKYPGSILFLTHVDRTPQEQLKLFCQGRIDGGSIVTYKDGYSAKSAHNFMPARAIDIAVRTQAGVSWNPELYKDIGKAIFDLGYSGELAWGGDWTSFKDVCHIEAK